MTRIIEIIKNTISFHDKINTWVDIGSGNGSTTLDLPWNEIAEVKYSIEPYGVPILDETWKIVNSLEDVTDNIDLTTLMDVIEHFEKDKGKEFLKNLEQQSKHIVIFTPLGFLRQDFETHPEFTGNDGMIHRSGWYPADFDGYNIKILENFHYPRGHNKHFSAILAWR